MSAVAIAYNPDVGQAVREALGFIDLEPLVKGKLVAVKPNGTYATAENKNGVTQPDTLRAVLQVVKQFNPGRLVVSGGSGAGQTGDIYRTVGLMDVIEGEGVEFFDHNQAPFQEVWLDYAPEEDVKGPQWKVMVNPRVLEYETLISLSQLKVHATAGITMALKNIALSFPAADYYGHPRGSEEYHKHDFFKDLHSFIAAMAKRFPIDLAITSGHPAMIGTGPLKGLPVETGLVIASTDALAADVVGARLLGFNAQAIHHLWEAGRLGVGNTKVENMDFPGLDIDEAVKIFTQAAYGQELEY